METVIVTDKGHGRSGHDSEVMITLDGVPRKIKRGNYLVAELKRILQIDPCHDLDEVICREFRPLEDSGTIDVKGGEVFVSHVRCGGSS